MKTLNEAKKVLRLCYGASTRWGVRRGLWLGRACSICGDCCPECNMRGIIHWVWPELLNYRRVATEKEWLAWALTDDDNWGLTEEEKAEAVKGK